MSEYLNVCFKSDICVGKKGKTGSLGTENGMDEVYAASSGPKRRGRRNPRQVEYGVHIFKCFPIEKRCAKVFHIFMEMCFILVDTYMFPLELENNIPIYSTNVNDG